MLFAKSAELPTAETALPGRAEPLATDERHFVSGNPLKGPYPEGFETAIFGMGCFWGVERIFWQTPGIWVTSAGYSGGITPNPTYEEVCSGLTGHAEVVQVTFDPAVIDYATLLDVFFTIHDPTTLNRQGHDVGSQYRSAIFYHDDNQQQQATTLIDTLNASGLFPSPIVTEVTPAGIFYPAENYHQSYYLQHPQEPYCQAVIAPKLHKFQQLFNHLRRAG